MGSVGGRRDGPARDWERERRSRAVPMGGEAARTDPELARRISNVT
jgi:hypothetical protein